MKFKELSLEDTEKLSNELARMIDEDRYRPDVVLFVESAGYYIGTVVADYFGVPSYGIKASRQGSRAKKTLSPVLRLVPGHLKKALRLLEVSSGIHKKFNTRNVGGIEASVADFNRLLIVDDSVDTGLTMKAIVNYLKQNVLAESVELRTASLNVFTNSLLKPDYYLFEDCLIQGPWSTDHKN